MFVCVENPRTSRYVMDLMQDQALDQKFSKQPKQDSLRFADVNTVRMKLESVMELTAHYRSSIKLCVPNRMRCLLILVLAVSLVGILFVPNTFASHDTDKQWGTIYVDKPVLELPYSAWDDSDYEKIKIFGTVEDAKSATWVYFTITEPDGKNIKVKAIASDNGSYVNYILICCNNVGQYSVDAEWKGHHIGTVTFEVIEKLAAITEEAEVVIQGSIQKVPNWVRSIFIWYASEQISEDELLNAIKYLVNQEIINLNE